ncbi:MULTISPECIES: ABC transporter permease [unclassified Glutamicibacter]|uniref:ABC transporter permease n=1 Tax=unclassified Glutamicibacter TaxID=2627139 RepID=UPI0038175AE1
MPPPTKVFPKAIELLAEKSFWVAMWQTVYGWALSILGAAIIAVPLGAFLGRNRFADGSSKLLIDVVRAVPTVALLPLGLILLGASQDLKIILVGAACIWPLTVQVTQGVKDIDPVTADMGRGFRFSTWQNFKWILVPSVGIYLSSGLRVVSVLGLFAVLGIELIGGISGLGYRMAVAQEVGNSILLLAYVVWTTVLAVIVNTAVVTGENKLFHWHSSRRPAND